MKDRYLFKAKRLNWREFPEKEQWITGYYVLGFNEYEQPVHLIFEPTSIFSSHGKTDGWIEVDPSTICQCTGLRDRNGNLIWENDIIHKPFYTDYDAYANSEAYTGRIQYEDGGWSIEITKSDGSVCVSAIIDMIAYSKDIEHFEVIGNIFDNPKARDNR